MQVSRCNAGLRVEEPATCNSQLETADRVFMSVLAPPRRRRLALWMTLGVVLLLWSLLVTLAVMPGRLPPRGPLFELLWAAGRQPMFYPLVGVLLLGPPLTWLAWRVPGRHRLGLVLAWSVFALVVSLLFQEHVELMLRVLWWRVRQG